MAAEYDRKSKPYKRPKIESNATEREFENLVRKIIPSWTAVWYTILEENTETRKRKCEPIQRIDLQKKIQKKISELIDKEETLVNLYTKAAEAAKKKEEEFKGKTVNLMQQIEKDKNLIKMLNYVN